MKTILVPTDFSANASNAILYAAELASQVNGKIILVHAMHELIIANPEEPTAVQPGVLLQAGYLGELQKISRNIRLEHGFRFEVECICEPAPLFKAVQQLVLHHKVDLVVIGTRGANTFLEKLFGTNTVEVMEEVSCPVLAIPANSKFKGFKEITYASDFEKDEILNLHQLIALTTPFSGQLQVLNIQADDELDLVADGQIITQITHTLAGQTYTIAQVKAGSVIQGIKDYLTRNPTEILAVALEKRSCFESLFNKSVSAELAYSSTIPFLTLPAAPYKTFPPTKPVQQMEATV